MPDRPVILTGFMGSGKSSVGRLLATQLAYRFIDLDEEIITSQGCSINEIFAREGEASFRATEAGMLEKLLSEECDDIILATGGGAVIADSNRSLMRRLGTVVNLKASLEQVLTRLQGCEDRPLMAGDYAAERAERLMNDREQFYADADIRIDTNGKSVEDVADEILSHLKGRTA
ncbi:MAG TPA: shikimate kinase [Desulfuromonadales bacterium]|nr:shikimate kinase [Desulfuromonadales bacterium]